MFRMTAQSQSVSTALIHSVVVLNISDQWTRLCVQNGSPQPVFGALLGKQTGRNIEIWNSFELKSTIIEIERKQKRHLIEEEYFLQRCVLFKETYADLDFLGFYVCGDHEKTTGEDIHLQRQAWPHNESPFLLKFNAAMPVISDKVAISIFDSSLDPSDENRLIFQSIPVKIVSEMAEQIGLDHVARYSKTGATTESTVSKQMGAQFGAINTFIHGLTIAHDYIQAVKAGEVDRDEAILREIHKLCMKLSVHNVQTHKEIEKDNLQISDHKLLILLSALCNVQGSMYNLVEKVNVLAKEHLHRERSSMVQHPTSILGSGRIAGSNFPRFFF